MDNRPIGIFDSGIGGLTVFTEIKKQLPQESLIYLGDTKRVPYGDKSKETIIEFSKQCTAFLIEKNVKCIVIACGTATSQALDTLVQISDIPIIGIISPTISFLKTKKTKNSIFKIGVIATKGTIHSNEWKHQIEKELGNACVFNKACPMLAPMAEEGWTQNEAAKFAIHEYLKELKQRQINQLILGCTHYPLFTNLIQKEMGENIELINTGKTVAFSLKSLLKEKNILNSSFQNKDAFYFTDMEPDFISLANILFKNIDLSTAQKAELNEK